MPTSRTDEVTVDDGRFDLHVWLPEAGQGPGLVLVQEIFGVGEYIRAVGERLAALGYVVGAPDMFWRQQRNWQPLNTEEGMADSLRIASQIDPQQAVGDVLASLERLGQLDEVTGTPAVIGFCFGGTMSWAAAIHGQPALAVSYYGSGVPSMLDELDSIMCPVLLHFGGNDAFIPAEGVQQVERAVAGRADIEIHVHQGAGHAFDNFTSSMFSQPQPAAEAWAQTTAFLSRHLPVR